ncbi:YuiB family protein [Metabacillus sp. 84]|uniref:YuiB family protein n=1 Tax=unclassified Metabacillus TaxID=2675274 RepID=UPI003CF1BD1F
MILPVFIISIVLFFVLFFGIGFLLNMLLRMSWIMAIIYPVICILIIDEITAITYFTAPGEAFPELLSKVVSLQGTDITILASGLAGAICSGFVIQALRKKGYQMF